MASNHRGEQGHSIQILKWVVIILGSGAFVFSLYKAALGSIDREWVLLSLVTVILISRIDIRLPKSSSAITLSDTFIFTSVLLYGVPLSVLLAGIEAAPHSLTH